MANKQEKFGAGFHRIEDDLDDITFTDPLKKGSLEDTENSETMTQMMSDIAAFFIELANKEANLAEFNRLYPEPNTSAEAA